MGFFSRTPRVSTDERIIDETKTRLDSGFIGSILKIAMDNGKTSDEIYQLWRKHVAINESMDQSPTLSEFISWNKFKVLE